MGELDKVKEMANRPLNELLTRDMVDLYVGPDATHWILHEKLLCAKSAFFRRTFYNSHNSSSGSSSPTLEPSHDDQSPATKSLGLPDDDDAAFTTFVAWLYSSVVPPPYVEDDLAVLYELYLMSERWGIPILQEATLTTVRDFYARTDSYPGLRRVQYVYANTSTRSPMRELLVGSVARMLVLGEGMKDGSRGVPMHWDKALRKNGQLAVDIIGKVQDWSFNRDEVPDVRKGDSVSSKKVEKVQDEEEHDREEDEHESEMKQEGESFNMKTLEKELPNGLMSGIH